MLNKLHKNEQGAGLVEALSLVIIVGVILAIFLPYMLNTITAMETKLSTIQAGQTQQAQSTAEILAEIEAIKEEKNITSNDNAETEITNQISEAQKQINSLTNNPDAVAEYLKEAGVN